MKYGLIGEKLSHSYSCEIHKAIADYEYELKALSPCELDEFFAKRDFEAINVTIPYKQKVFDYLDFVSDEARKIGAVNTVVKKDGKLYGYNTDYYGIVALLDKANINPQGKKVLILGTGGTSNTAYAVFKDMGANEILKVSRRKSDEAITYDEAKSEHCDAQIIFNATPVGMYPNDENCPIDLSVFKCLLGVLDAVYHPLNTSLVLQAKSQGVKAIGGLYMLSAQAVYASKLFMGESIDNVDKSLVDKAYTSVLKQKQNIVLVGMPSSGKSCVGSALARLLNSEFVDTDVEIEKRIAMPIADYFATHGEQGFRDIESEIIQGVSKESGFIISTGGGSVLKNDNVNALKRNGVIVFLDRAIDNLISTSSRPLSSDRQKLEKLFEQRYGIYCNIADIKVDGNRTIDEVANDIIKELEL